MYGAILGDMIGAPYEFDRGNKTKEFPLFCDESQLTDDTVMTVAVAEALMKSDEKSAEEIKTALVKSMQKWGERYPNAGYGARFSEWLEAKNPQPYNSCGNGSAMRVSSAGWLYDSIEETREKAKLTAEVTHNHPEGIKGAEATASAIFLARNGKSKEEIRDYIVEKFGYNLSRTCDEIRPCYFHVETCQETVPEAITAFLEGTDFEDVIRTAVSLGGDCDTLTCIAGAIAEAFYGVPEEMENECRKRTFEDMLEVVDEFDNRIGRKVKPFCNVFLDGNEAILKEAIEICNRNRTKLNILKLLQILRDSWVWVPCNAIMSEADGKILEKAIEETEDGEGIDSLVGKNFTVQDNIRLVPDILQNGESFFFPVFTSASEMGEYGERFSKIEKHFLEAIILAKNNERDIDGIVINAFSEPFVINKELFEMIEELQSSLEK